MNDVSWVDREAYPFRSNYFDVDGFRMHYVDEGHGAPIVLVHGTTTWSFIFRRLIQRLSRKYRCIALDHLGYGLSEKPPGISYLPEDQARRLRLLIEYLELRDMTLVVHDFGGPIGLSYAVQKPEQVKALILFNTWMWSLKGEILVELAGRVGGGPLGRILVKRLNLEMHILFKAVWGNSSNLSKDLHKQYLMPFPRTVDRQAMWVLAGELLRSGPWYNRLWQQRERIRDIPALLLWGMKDIIFKERHLNRWTGVFDIAEPVTFPEAGHFVQEEAHAQLNELFEDFLQKYLR